MILLPDPPLRSGEMLLRPWRAEDAPALVEAWADEQIQRWTAVPERRDLAAARRWILGDQVRRQRWLSLDLVVEVSGEVAGEVGLSSFDRHAGTVEIGWWTASAHRGRGVASSASALVVTWCRRSLSLDSVVARCDAANPASVVVAKRSGAMVHV